MREPDESNRSSNRKPGDAEGDTVQAKPLEEKLLGIYVPRTCRYYFYNVLMGSNF
jgi:hypothetical protein